ncbi:MAG: hypothetical protein M0Z67_04245 [Nitrospiraceae bacterium]|nr:hypothetical protein [Nitrospiraceae bacterium]
MAEVSIKQRYINITVDTEKIHKAFQTLCPEAHKGGEGKAEDTLYLSYHFCPDSDKLREAQALLKTIEMAENEGCIHSDQPFSLQGEYDEYLKGREAQEPDKKKGRYLPGDWRYGK